MSDAVGSVTDILPEGEPKGDEEPSSSKDQNQEEEEDPESAAIAAMMGFGGFDSSKVSSTASRPTALENATDLVQGKGNGPQADGEAAVHKQRTWRQYMNRRGGFNRPLDYMK